MSESKQFYSWQLADHIGDRTACQSIREILEELGPFQVVPEPPRNQPIGTLIAKYEMTLIPPEEWDDKP